MKALLVLLALIVVAIAIAPVSNDTARDGVNGGWATTLINLSKQTGLTTEAIQALRIEGARSGLSEKEVDAGLIHFATEVRRAQRDLATPVIQPKQQELSSAEHKARIYKEFREQQARDAAAERADPGRAARTQQALDAMGERYNPPAR
jgi:hypothetical protein